MEGTLHLCGDGFRNVQRNPHMPSKSVVMAGRKTVMSAMFGAKRCKKIKAAQRKEQRKKQKLDKIASDKLVAMIDAVNKASAAAVATVAGNCANAHKLAVSLAGN